MLWLPSRHRIRTLRTVRFIVFVVSAVPACWQPIRKNRPKSAKAAAFLYLIRFSLLQGDMISLGTLQSRPFATQERIHGRSYLFKKRGDTIGGQGHLIVNPNLFIFKLLAGYGCLFFGYAPHSPDEWEFQNGLYGWSL
jgi:hypothetical protein